MRLDVSSDLIDSVELERTVSSLNQELAASRKAEEELQARLQELDKVDGLLKQVDDDDHFLLCFFFLNVSVNVG